MAGLKTAGALTRVNLTVTDGAEELSWDAPVWFCDPWPHPFGLAGLKGFLHDFVVTTPPRQLRPRTAATAQTAGGSGTVSTVA